MTYGADDHELQLQEEVCDRITNLGVEDVSCTSLCMLQMFIKTHSH